MPMTYRAHASPPAARAGPRARRRDAAAGASTLVDRNATGVTLKALRTAKGVDVALLTYRTRGSVHRVLAYGAINM